MNWRPVLGIASLASVIALAGVAQEAPKKKGKDFTGKPLRMADFKGQNLENAIFDEANLFLASFHSAHLVGASFRKADATSATFSRADMTGADLRGAILARSSFDAILAKANLEGVDLGGASLQGADFRGANLRKVTNFGDITGADFSDADLRGAVLLGSKDYSKSAKFKGAKYDKGTRWPLGFDVEASGAVLTDSPVGDSSGKKDPSPDDKPDDGKPLAPNKPAGAPSEEIVKKTLENQFWGPAREFTKQRYRYRKMAYFPPVEREITVGGAVSKVVTFPVAVAGDVMVDYPDGVTKTFAKDQSFVFYKDDTEVWRFFFIGDN